MVENTGPKSVCARLSRPYSNNRKGVTMGRRKKRIEEEVREGLRRLAFGEIQDAILLLFADENEIMEKLPRLDLFNVSEIKRPKGGGMEIKFFDRIRALEKLRDTKNESPSQPLSFYRALEEGALSVKNAFDGERDE